MKKTQRTSRHATVVPVIKMRSSRKRTLAEKAADDFVKSDKTKWYTSNKAFFKALGI